MARIPDSEGIEGNPRITEADFPEESKYVAIRR